MPLIMIDVVEGRTDNEVTLLLDAVHRAVVEAFDVPVRDRYQVVHEHRRSHFVVEDTGLGIERSDDVVVVRVVSRPRTFGQKEALYRNLCDQLERACGTKPTDVVVSIIENTDEDWSFGFGRAQFLTGEL